MTLRQIAIYGGVLGSILGYYVLSAYESNGGVSFGEGVVTVVLLSVMLGIGYLLRKILEARARRT